MVIIEIKNITTNLNFYNGGYEFHDHYIMDRYVNQWSDIHTTLIEVKNKINIVLIVRI